MVDPGARPQLPPFAGARARRQRDAGHGAPGTRRDRARLMRSAPPRGRFGDGRVHRAGVLVIPAARRDLAFPVPLARAGAEIPFRVPLYPVTPILFCATSACATCSMNIMHGGGCAGRRRDPGRRRAALPARARREPRRRAAAGWTARVSLAVRRRKPAATAPTLHGRCCLANLTRETCPNNHV